MRFNQLPEQPLPDQMIDWPLAGESASHLPPQHIASYVDIPFHREFQYWNMRLGEEYPDGDQTVIRLAKLMRSRIMHGKDEIMRVLDPTASGLDTAEPVTVGPEYADLSAAGYAYMQGVTALAMAHMCHQAQIEDSALSQYDAGAIVIDSNPECLPKSGIHFKSEPLSDIIGINQPARGRIVWLEGDYVFLQARSPADPTPEPEMTGRQEQSVIMNLSEYTSVVPRLKPEAFRL